MIRVPKSELIVGSPLEYPIFDRDRQLLMRAGEVIDSEHRLAQLLARGVYRSGEFGPAPASGGSDDREAGGREERWQTWTVHDLKLPLGTRMSLQKLDPGDDTRYSATLLGMLREVSLIVEIPSSGGKLAMFRQGQPLLMRVFNGTRAFAFTGSVLVIRYSPGAYLHLEWPKTVEGTEVRARHRVKVRLIAVASRPTPEGEADATPVTIEDLSVGGARVLTEHLLGHIGEETVLAFRLKAGAGEATLKLRASIRTVTPPAADTKATAYGVQFGKLEPMEHLALEGFVHRLRETGASSA